MSDIRGGVKGNYSKVLAALKKLQREWRLQNKGKGNHHRWYRTDDFEDDNPGF